jgi:hypothetical protein
MFNFSRILIIYAIAVVLALILGCLVVWPNQLTVSIIGLVLFVFSIPLWLKWHHALLIVFWNSVFLAFFLPGSPGIWLFFAGVSFVIAFLNHIMFQKSFLRAPELTRPVLFLLAVILITACVRGGIGIRSLGGSSFGGRYYLYVIGAILGYFALTSQRIAIPKQQKMAGWYFLSLTTSILSNIVYLLGPAFYILYIVVPTDAVPYQMASDYAAINVDRIAGLASACVGVFCFLLIRYGIRGLCDWEKPWRFLLLCLTFGAAFFSGFRSIVVILAMIFCFQFYFERLLRTHFLPIFIALAVVGFSSVLLFSEHLPFSVQRAVSFLPVKVDSEVLADAKSSSDWRFQMWAMVRKEIPKYWLVGKGYVIDPDAIYAAVLAEQMQLVHDPFEGPMLSGDFHSGPLSVIIPFGIFGVIGFLWVLIGGGRVLYSNYRYGDVKLRRVNTLLLSYYLAYCVSFFFIFGALNSQLCVFLGVCGLSVSLNGGVKRRAGIKQKLLPFRRPLAAQPEAA